MEQQRLFTRADVEKLVMECLGKNPKYTVDKICLLKEMPAPAWIVYCTVTWEADTEYEHSYPSVSVVFQRSGIVEPYLYFAIQADLPPDLASAAEEDAAIAQREAEEHAKWLHKQG